MRANNRFEFARTARPTHKVRCTLLAAQAQRWAAEPRMNMSSERNRRLLSQQKRCVAGLACACGLSTVYHVVSQLRSPWQQHDCSARSSLCGQALSIRSCFRSSSRKSRIGRSGYTPRSRISVVRSASVAGAYTAVRAIAPPNNSLVPTPVTSAPSLRSYRGAAHLRR